MNMDMGVFKQYYLSQAKAALDGYFAAGGEKTYFTGRQNLTEHFASALMRIQRNALDMLLVNRIIDSGLLAAYLDGSEEEKEHIAKVKEDFAAALAENGEDMIKEASPRLYEHVKKAKEQYIDALNDFFTRFEQDAGEISKTLLDGRTINTITELDIGCGDTHNHGRSVIITETDAGKFVYKPHDITIDAWTEKLFAKFFPGVCVLPKTVVRDGYGYCGYVANSPAQTQQEAALYYRNLGGLCAVSHLLGSRDLHCENILSDGTHPVPVDLEMTLSAAESAQYFQQESVAPQPLKHTVLSTGFLPFRIGDQEISILFSEWESNRACPVAEGKKITAENFREEFIGGFEQAYKSALAQKEEIREYIENMPDMCVRVLMRATQPYAVLLHKTHELGWLQDKNVRSKIREALSRGFTKAGITVNDEIVDSETAAVEENNVPYFYTRTKGRDIYDADGVVTAGYFDTTCVENALRNFDDISEDDLRFECEILKKSFTRRIREAETNYARDVDEVKSFDFVNEAEQLFAQLLEDSLYAGTDSRDRFWFVKSSNLATGMAASGNSLFDGKTGIALFVAALSRITKNEQVRQQAAELCSDLLRHILEDIQALERVDKICENVCNCSFSVGLAGLLHANELINSYTGNPLCAKLRGALLEMLPRMDYTFSQNDFVGGLAGLIAVLCSYDCLYEAPGTAREVQKLADLLLSKRKNADGLLLWDTIPPHIISGLGHGQAGIGLALGMAAKRLGKDEYAKAAEDAYIFEDRVFSPELNGWPDFRPAAKGESAMHGYCSGAPGVGLVMMSLGTELGRKNLERAIKSCMEHPLLHVDHLCCGNCAAADFLIEAGMRLQREELSAKGREILCRVLTRAQKNGALLLTNPMYENLFDPTLFYGAAGVGYTCLRCAAPDVIKNILAL